MKVDKGELAACGVVLAAFGAFTYFYMIPAFKEVLAERDVQELATEQCHAKGGLVMKNFSDSKLYCVRYDYTVLPNWFNGKEAK